ncbi:MAG TPA: hypothetical protein VH518_19450 [Tepidisphaeraceae bacterium]|jgi:hypothetical protein
MFALVVGGLLLLGGGCGKKNPIDGTYHDSSGLMTFDFDRGECDVTVTGIMREYTYVVSGNTVTVKPRKGVNAMVFKIQPDGSLLNTETGNTLTKKK